MSLNLVLEIGTIQAFGIVITMLGTLPLTLMTGTIGTVRVTDPIEIQSGQVQILVHLTGKPRLNRITS